jgi:DNA-binding Lrp family transcriptional regulator
MTLTEDKIMEMLSKSEVVVYEYIKSECSRNNGSLKQSMDKIGEHLSLSEATVHRAVRKLRKQGIIGIVPSMEKAESNEIVYYGIPDPDKQVHDIFKMIGELSNNANRFEMILKAKEQQIEQLMRDKELLYERIDQVEAENKQLLMLKTGFDASKIVSSQPLDDGTIAYIIKTSE